MTHPEDNSAILKTADEIRAYAHDQGFTEGQRSRDAEVAAVQKELADYKASHPEPLPTDPKPPVEPDKPTPPSEQDGKTTIGMSSLNKDWSTRLSQVGAAGITARRIFAILGSDEQMDIVADAVKANMTPIYSFKITNITTSNVSSFDSQIDALMKKISAALSKTGYGAKASITFWHEPSPDIAGALFVAANKRFAPIVHKYSNLSFGPLINGWLLDNQVSTFLSYTDKTLLAGGTNGWDFLGIDTYESGTADSPGKIKPADRIPKLVKFCKDQGVAGKELRIGEYNGYSAATISACGKAILDEPSVAVGMMWNATGGKGWTLEGDRLSAFKATKADSRVRK